MEQAPECWGKFDQCGRKCEFATACRLCTETESRMNRPIGGQDFDGVAEWAPDLADYSHIPGDDFRKGGARISQKLLRPLRRMCERVRLPYRNDGGTPDRPGEMYGLRQVCADVSLRGS